MRCKSVAAEASMTLQQPEACSVFSQGICSWIMGPRQWRAAQAPGRGGVGNDLCLHTGLVFHARLWGPR